MARRRPTPPKKPARKGKGVERAAVAAGVTSPTVRLFEADPSATPRARPKLESFYARLAEQLAANTTTPPAAA